MPFQSQDDAVLWQQTERVIWSRIQGYSYAIRMEPGNEDYLFSLINELDRMEHHHKVAGYDFLAARVPSKNLPLVYNYTGKARAPEDLQPYWSFSNIWWNNDGFEEPKRP